MIVFLIRDHIANHTNSNNEVFKIKNIEKVGPAFWVHVTFL
ncbi:hypothetical protein SAMN04488111_0802 [Lutibacter flavus]|uniref:Uncharacterized protein n=1 Tax=Lutibacter flavus TaxID=691689 RepID=A0A238VPB8_9FLAO|nr:hypothetical protein SAMN04488111_0802 [Lutibacter flavus]